MNKNANIQAMLEKIETILEAAHTTVSAMNDGDRMQIKKLAQAVGQTVSMEPKHVLSFVNHFAHNSDIAYVTRGKNGGIIRGVKPAKVAKVSKRVKKVDAPTVTDVSSAAAVSASV